MKKYTLRLVRLMFSLAVILALAMWFADAAHAQGQMPPMKGGEHMRMLSGIDTQAQAEELKPGDEIAMVCAKCKTVSVTLITKDNKNRVTVMTPGEKHLCPGCQGTMESLGAAKANMTSSSIPARIVVLIRLSAVPPQPKAAPPKAWKRNNFKIRQTPSGIKHGAN